MALKAGVNGAAYLGTQVLLQDREILNEVADLYEENDWIKMFLGEGKMVETKQPSYSSGISAPLSALIDTTGGTVTNNATTAVTVLFTAGNSGYLNKYDTCRFPNGAVGWVSSKSTSGGGADTIIFTSVDSSTLSVTAGEKLSNFGNAYEEGSKLAPAIRNIPSFIGNKVQIIKHSVEMTDIRKAQSITVKDRGNGQQLGRLNGAQIEGRMIQEAKIAYTMLMGRISTTSFEDTTPTLAGEKGNGVQTTRGMDPYITAYGISDTVATPGTVLMSDIDDYIARLVAARVTREVMLVGAQAPIQKLSNFYKNTNSSGVESVQLNFNGHALDLTVEQVKYGQFTLKLGAVNFLSNSQFVDQSSSLAKEVFGLPSGKCPTLSGGSIDYWRTRYMEIDGHGHGTSQMAEWHYGIMAGGNGNGTDSVHGVEFQSIVGLEMTAPHKFSKLIVTA